MTWSLRHFEIKQLLQLLVLPSFKKFVFIATLMLFVSNCNGLDKGCRESGAAALGPETPVRMDLSAFCSFNDVWAWNLARGACEVVTGTRDSKLETWDSGLAYQFIISFNKVDISPRPLVFVRLQRVDHGSRSWVEGCLGFQVSTFRCWSLSRLAFWHFRSLIPDPHPYCLPSVPQAHGSRDILPAAFAGKSPR